MLKTYLKKVSGSLRPNTLVHVHLASALPYDTHDAWVRYGTFDSQCFVVELLEAFGVFLLSVHLDLKCIHL